MGLGFLLFSLLMLSGLTAASNAAQIVLALVAATLPGVIAVRCFRANVAIVGEEVIRRGYFRTQRVGLADIADVEIVPSWNGIWRGPELRTHDGMTVELNEAAQIGERGPASDFVEALSALLRSRP
ncbi:MAG: hypothetical protein ACOYML_08555 [Microthrixaceae bacterium]